MSSNTRGFSRRVSLVICAVVALALLAACAPAATPTPAPTAAPAKPAATTAPAATVAPAATAAPKPAATTAPAAVPTTAPAKPAATTAPAAGGKTVRQAVQPSVSNTAVYVGIEKGFFAKEGLNIQPVNVGPVGDIVAGMVGGSIDFGIGAMNAIGPAFAQGAPINIIAPIVSGGGRYALVARTGSGIKSAKDLPGKKVAVQNGSAGQEGYMLTLAKYGVDPKTVETVNILTPEIPAAMATGRVDAGFIWDPYPLIVEEQKTGEIVLRAGDVLAAYGSAFVLKPFLDKERATVKSWLKAHLQAMKWLRNTANRQEAAAIIAKYNPASPINQVAKSLEVLSFDPRFTPYFFEQQAVDVKFVKDIGVLKTDVDPTKVAYPALVEEIMKEQPDLVSDLKP